MYDNCKFYSLVQEIKSQSINVMMFIAKLKVIHERGHRELNVHV